MFNSKAFNIAFLISLIWHFTCIAAVNIVVLPGKFKMRDITSVSFLGPILAMDTMSTDKPAAVTPSYEGDLESRRHMYDAKKEILVPVDTVKDGITRRTEDKMHKVLGVPFVESKSVPGIVRSSRKPVAMTEDGRQSGISGPVSTREIFYKPQKPIVPEWVESSMPFAMEFKFFISAQGEVREVIPLVSSGNAEVDLLGIRYLKGWKFTPVAAGYVSGKAGSEWGRIKIVLSKE